VGPQPVEDRGRDVGRLAHDRRLPAPGPGSGRDGDPAGSAEPGLW
jgi:hypothetical protein